MTNPTAIVVLPVSHVDHGLTPEQLAWALASAHENMTEEYLGAPSVLVQTFTLPPELGTLLCGLHGPLVGSAPVPESEATYAVRGTRKGTSRLCARAALPTRRVSVIVGPHEGQLALYTAFGGPVAPREPFELPEGSEERTASEAFWAKHALSA